MSATTRPLSTGQAVWLVAEREIQSKIRSKPFIISTAILFIVALAGILFMGFSGQNTDADATPFAATSDVAGEARAHANLDVVEVADRAEAEQLILDGDVRGAVVGDGSSPSGYTLVFKDDPSGSQTLSGIVMSFADLPTVDVIDTGAPDPFMRYIVAVGFGVVFLLAASMFGGTIAQSVVEEKQTRVVEILISAIPTRTLLAGKVIGNTVLAMGQVLGLAAIVIIGLTITGQTMLLTGLGVAVVWFAIFFLFGFILLASMFAAAAAMVSRQEDIGSTTTPITMLIMAPYMLVIIFNDNPLVMTIMSYVPFSAPVGMPMRLFLGEAQWWEPILSLLILIATCIAAIAIGARIYDRTLLKMGGRVKLMDALRG